MPPKRRATAIFRPKNLPFILQLTKMLLAKRSDLPWEYHSVLVICRWGWMSRAQWTSMDHRSLRFLVPLPQLPQFKGTQFWPISILGGPFYFRIFQGNPPSLRAIESLPNNYMLYHCKKAHLLGYPIWEPYRAIESLTHPALYPVSNHFFFHFRRRRLLAKSTGEILYGQIILRWAKISG